jgi:transposase
MFIRQTKTSTSSAGETYFTFRLVASERVGNKVRQRTLLNLGRNFSLPRDKWPQLCARIEQLLYGQTSLVPAVPEVEKLAQRYAGRLTCLRPAQEQSQANESPQYQEVDIDSLELVRPRSIGVEHVGMEALTWLGLPKILEEAGLNAVQRNVAIGSIIGRMAQPGSELATWKWLTERSGLGELLDVDYEALPLMRLYRTSDLLVRHRETIENRLFAKISDLFSLGTTVTLYDLTNTYFEGSAGENSQAKRGHSKEKRSDCPIVTLGLVLDGSGFVRRSKVFDGNVSENTTLEEMLTGLDAPKEALVIMDRGIATQANIDWLVEHQFRYLVVSREHARQFDENQAVTIESAKKKPIEVQRVVSEDGREARLYCRSEQRQGKEKAISARFTKRFEDGLRKIAESLTKPRGTKQRDKVLERIGRLKEKSRGIGQHYQISLTYDETGNKVASLTWKKDRVDGTQLTHPGVYCLRTNELDWDEAILWRTYTMLTDLEAVFRSLKSELGLRPIYHRKEERTEGHLFITVLAYQAVQAIRCKLRGHGMSQSWSSLRKVFAGQQRITATFRQKDGRTLHVRKATVAEMELKKIYDVLGLSATPGGIRKVIN